MNAGRRLKSLKHLAQEDSKSHTHQQINEYQDQEYRGRTQRYRNIPNRNVDSSFEESKKIEVDNKTLEELRDELAQRLEKEPNQNYNEQQQHGQNQYVNNITFVDNKGK